MRKVLMYQCEICEHKYESKIEALECESKGKESLLLSVGDVVRHRVPYSEDDLEYIEITVNEIIDKGHYPLYILGLKDEDESLNEIVRSLFEYIGNEELCKNCIF